ncbi:MAG: peptidoglycan bridge formation glycyltransferase FemA/FemB family protein [Patescibacteria group bacterium]
MEIKIGKNKESWNNWFLKQNGAEFLQSWEWGEFQNNAGKEALRLQVVEDGLVKAQFQGFAHKLPFGFKYLYVPRADFKNLKLETGNWKLEALRYLREKDFTFMRLEPSSPISSFKFLISPAQNRQPQTTLVIDISSPEEKILQEMHPKTRYNIRLAEKKAVAVKKEKDSAVFWQLNEETKKRDGFRSHDKMYYQKMLELPNVFQLTAYLENKPIASNICVYFGDTFTYLHGASANAHRNLMAPYLLQWEGMKLAKSLSCKYYDFWGISPSIKCQRPGDGGKQPETCFHGLCWRADHQWIGVTRFKAGFGGFVKEYPKAVDVVFKKAGYKLYQLVRAIKNVKVSI